MSKLLIKIAEILLPIIAQIIAREAKKWLERDEKSIKEEEKKIEAVNKAAKKAEDAVRDINRKIADAKAQKVLSPIHHSQTASHRQHTER